MVRKTRQQIVMFISMFTLLLMAASYIAFFSYLQHVATRQELDQQHSSYPSSHQIVVRQEEDEAPTEHQIEINDPVSSLPETSTSSTRTINVPYIYYNHSASSFENGTTTASAEIASATFSWSNATSHVVTANATLPSAVAAEQSWQGSMNVTYGASSAPPTNITEPKRPASLKAIFKDSVDENGKKIFAPEHYDQIQEEIRNLPPDLILPEGETGTCEPLPDDPCVNTTAALQLPKVQAMLKNADGFLNYGAAKNDTSKGNATVHKEHDKHLGPILGTTLGIGIPASAALYFTYTKAPAYLSAVRYWIERINLVKQAQFIRRVGDFWRDSVSDFSRDYEYMSDWSDLESDDFLPRSPRSPEEPPTEAPPPQTPPAEAPPAEVPPADVPSAALPPPAEPIPPASPLMGPLPGPPAAPVPLSPVSPPLPPVPVAPIPPPVAPVAPTLPGFPGSLPALPDSPSLPHIPDLIPDGLFHGSHGNTDDKKGREHKDGDKHDGNNNHGKDDPEDPDDSKSPMTTPRRDPLSEMMQKLTKRAHPDCPPKLHKAEAEIRKLRGELRRAQQEVEEAHEQRRQSRRDLRSSMEELDKTWEQILEDTTAEKDLLEEQLDEHAVDLANTIGDLEEAGKKVQEKTAEAGRLRAQRERLEREYKKASRTVTSLQIEKLDLKRQIEIEGENSAMLKTKLKLMEENLEKSQKIMGGVTKSLNDVIHNYGSLTKELESLRDDHCKKSEALDQAEKHKSQLLEELQKAQSQNKVLEKQVQTEADQKRQCTAELDKLKNHQCPISSTDAAKPMDPIKEIEDLRKQREQLQNELQECANDLDSTRQRISSSHPPKSDVQDKDGQSALMKSIDKEIKCRSDKHHAAATHAAQLKYKDIIIQNREFRLQQCEAQRDHRPGPTGKPPQVPAHMPGGASSPRPVELDSPAECKPSELEVLGKKLSQCLKDVKTQRADGAQCWNQCTCPTGVRPGLDHFKRRSFVVV